MLRRGLAAAAAAAPAAFALRWARCEHHACTDEDVMSPAPQWRRGWEADWDGRHPAEGGECSGRTRHIFLIRHGQYDLNDRANGLTALGREQATLTGKRLAAIAAGVKRDHYGEVKIRFAELVSSPVLRAQQSAELIAAELDVPRAADDVQLAEGNHHLEGSRIEEVADQYARRVAPEGIGGGASAAHVGGVDHVVMQQGGGMQEFNDGSQLVLVRAVRVAGSGAEQHHQGAQTFAAGADDVMADLFHERYPGVQLVQDQLVDRSKVSGDRLVERQRAH